MNNFKKLQFAALSLALAAFGINNASAQQKPVTERYVHKQAGNPYLPLWEHVPDGEPRVFEDPDRPGKYRVYIIGSHDVRFGSYCGPDIRAWSAPIEDLNSWRDEGPIFTYPIDNQWDVMYAPDLVEVRRKDGTKEYYLYPHSRGPRREAMVCKGSRPDGPFTPVNLTEDGRSTVPGSCLGFDPSIFIEYVTNPNDPDYEIGFRAYGYWGFQHSTAAQLDQNTMYSVRPGTQPVDPFIPASFRYGELRDKGPNFPAIHPDEDLTRFNFFEASSIRQVGNKYVTVYSGYSGPDYGLSSTNSALRYAYSDSPLGPWKSGGVLVDSRGPVLNEDGSGLITTNGGHNTHGSIEKIGDNWYCFYHRPPRGFGNARQAVVAPVTISWDEKSVADGGKVVIRALDYYAPDGIWGAKDSRGNEYTGAEVTSEGFNMFGLPPYDYYSAGYACYLSDINLQQDTWDNWDNSMIITNVKSGNIIGYKYFGFGGLSKAKNGIKPFKGTTKGNGTMLNVWVQPQTAQGCTIEVWLDGPYDNATWNGKKIGEINIPTNAAKGITQYSVDVSAAVDGLDKKHAIFFKAVGMEDQPLFDLIGLGFSSKKNPIERPVPPTVNIMADGKLLEVPAIPTRSTNQNGIVDVTQYDIIVRTTTLPEITATASSPAVTITVEQAKDLQSVAKVKCIYNGLEKTYTITFRDPAWKEPEPLRPRRFRRG